ncbi:MAG: hypothetical protein ACKOCD_06495 [Nitrospiraceae bacterium]
MYNTLVFICTSDLLERASQRDASLGVALPVLEGHVKMRAT